MSEKYKIRDQDKPYFITISVVEWIDVITRPVYKEIVIESLQYCQTEKGLGIYAWCIMSNHLHLIIKGKGNVKMEVMMTNLKMTQYFGVMAKDLLFVIQFFGQSILGYMIQIQ
ncbi:MAG: transposase [Cyclobacteriaceae bacterium]|nr:transposase [Cyclobacteriaceae bacterium]